MSQFRLFRSVVAGALLAVMPVAGAANAQTSNPSVAAATCVGGPRALTKQEDSMVNDYEILVARANSQHTPVPAITPEVAALIACTAGSPAAPAASAPASTTSASPTTAATTCTGGPRMLSKQESDMVNEYEISVIRAGSQGMPPPAMTPDVAALIACSTGSPVASTATSAKPAAGAAAAAVCVGGPRPLTKQENSMVNDYEILLAKANSQHTTPPTLSPDVAALIACS